MERVSISRRLRRLTTRSKTMITAVKPSQRRDAENERSASQAAPKWMRNVLLAAAAYNLLWGAFAILSPLTIFRWAGFDPLPFYPQLWQCVGMIVGVYGIGYAIAATNPYRHWPCLLYTSTLPTIPLV